MHFTVASYAKKMLAIWSTVCKGLLTSVHLSDVVVMFAGQSLFPFLILHLGSIVPVQQSDYSFFCPTEIVPRDLRMKDKFLKHLTGMF